MTYFVFDPFSPAERAFAPAKFCAYLPVGRGGAEAESDGRTVRPAMTMDVYASLDGQESRFDGHRAQRHLSQGLAMEVQTVVGGSLEGPFEEWHHVHRDMVSVPPRGAMVLAPPAWFG